MLRFEEVLDSLIAAHRIDNPNEKKRGSAENGRRETVMAEMEHKTNKLFTGKALKLLSLAAGVLLVFGVGMVLPKVVSVNHNVKGRELPVYCVETAKPQIALTFDAAWGNEDTARILEILEKHSVKVTFFMTGGWVANYPQDVKAILEAGHDLGNHSENHKNMSQLSDEENKQELMKVHGKVKELTGYEMFLFRPPYGDYDNEVIKTARNCGYISIQWDVDSLDWKDYGAEAIMKRVCEDKNLGNGSIILCHNGAKFTADALDQLIVGLKAKGYEFVPVSQLIYREDYYLNHEGRQISNKKNTEASAESL